MKTIFCGFLMVLLCAGTVFCESVYIIPPNVKEIKYKAIVDVGAVITKPTCPAGWVASIFVTPAVFSAYSGTNLNMITVVKTSATDNGNGTWTVNFQLKDNAGNIINTAGGWQRLLVETMCCPAGGTCE